MKTRISVLSLLLMLFSLELRAQSSKYPFAKLGSEVRMHSRQVQLNLVPEVGWQLARHRLSAGALISKPDWQLSYPLRLSGLSLNYHYRLTQNNRFSFNLGAQLTTQTYTEAWTQTIWEEDQYVSRPRASREVCHSALLSSLLTFPLNARLAINLKLATGVYRARWQSVEGSSSFGSYAGYDSFGLSYRLGLGASYKLSRRKK